MAIIEKKAKSILLKRKRIDSWFISGCGMNLYRGCHHNCVYCDGRAEKYQVSGEFGKDVEVKINAPELLDRALNPEKKRKPFHPGFILPGGGVGDSYQPIEKKYRLTRLALEIMDKYHYPVHLLTKSTEILHDIDLLKKFSKKKHVLVSFSFSTVDKTISSVFEPGVPSPILRLDAIKRLTDEGIPCGVFLMPALPYLTDPYDQLEETIEKVKHVGAQYIVFGGLTLKTGKQKDHFYKLLKEFNPGLISYYEKLYFPDKWGSPSHNYSDEITRKFSSIANRYGMPKRIPDSLFRHILTENDLVSVLLDQMDYLLKVDGNSSPYGYASYVISQLKEPLSTMKDSLKKIKGVGQNLEKIILEILDTGQSSLYKTLI